MDGPYERYAARGITLVLGDHSLNWRKSSSSGEPERSGSLVRKNAQIESARKDWDLNPVL
jgi:hypothetical protein